MASAPRSERFIPGELGWGKIQTYLLKKLGERQCCSELCGEEKNLLGAPGIEPLYHIRPIYRLITIPKESFRLPSQNTSEKLNSTIANHTGVLVYIIAKSCFFRSDPHNTIDVLLVSRALRASSLAYSLLHCVSQEKRGNTFKSESKSILHATKAIHYGCYRIGSVLYL